jgi:mRNA interferase MazF
MPSKSGPSEFGPFEFGDVVLVPFPFTNQTASKQRPAVIVSALAYNRVKPDIVLMAITSQFRPSPALGEVWLREWQTAGLLKPSAVKPVFTTLEQALIIRQLGSLAPPRQNRPQKFNHPDFGVGRTTATWRRPLLSKNPPAAISTRCAPFALP